MEKTGSATMRCDNPSCLLHSIPVTINYTQLISKAIPTRRKSQSNKVCLCSQCSKTYRRQEQRQEDQEEWFLFTGITLPIEPPQPAQLIFARATEQVPTLEQMVAQVLGKNLEHPDVKVVRSRQVRTLIVTSLSLE
jgi:hypothetical protein